MPRIRFTVRRMMVAVGIVAVIVWGGLMWRRSVAFASRAENHRFLVTLFRERAEAETSAGRWGTVERMERDLQRVRHHSKLGGKYARAARYPWLPVAPDPPEPN